MKTEFDLVAEERSSFARYLCNSVFRSGEAWISVYPMGNNEVLRACITNYNSGETHLLKLVRLLNSAREQHQNQSKTIHGTS